MKIIMLDTAEVRDARPFFKPGDVAVLVPRVRTRFPLADFSLNYNFTGHGLWAIPNSRGIDWVEISEDEFNRRLSLQNPRSEV